MPIIVKAGPNYTPAPAGTHAAVCIDVVDLGELKVEFGGKAKMQHKLRIVWQIDACREDGKPFYVSKRYTSSLHEKASLRKDLESWRGGAFTAQELEGFDLENLLSIPCLLNIIHEKKNGQTYANVASIMRLPKSMAAPSPLDYVRVCDREPTEASSVDEPPDSVISDEDVPF